MAAAAAAVAVGVLSMRNGVAAAPSGQVVAAGALGGATHLRAVAMTAVAEQPPRGLRGTVAGLTAAGQVAHTARRTVVLHSAISSNPWRGPKLDSVTAAPLTGRGGSSKQPKSSAGSLVASGAWSAVAPFSRGSLWPGGNQCTFWVRDTLHVATVVHGSPVCFDAGGVQPDQAIAIGSPKPMFKCWVFFQGRTDAMCTRCAASACDGERVAMHAMISILQSLLGAAYAVERVQVPQRASGVLMCTLSHIADACLSFHRSLRVKQQAAMHQLATHVWPEHCAV
jgi:hypothetical protein